MSTIKAFFTDHTPIYAEQISRSGRKRSPLLTGMLGLGLTGLILLGTVLGHGFTSSGGTELDNSSTVRARLIATVDTGPKPAPTSPKATPTPGTTLAPAEAPTTDSGSQKMPLAKSEGVKSGG